jgi:regulator of protease activity HflC (stomatin/prohibitin superfamily)
VAIIIGLILTSTLVIINPGQAGVLSILGKAQNAPLLEGIHIKPPWCPLWTSMM